MKKVTLNIPDKHYSFFMELISRLDFVEASWQVDPKASKVFEDIVEGFHQIKRYQEGKLELKDAESLVDEL